MQENRSFDHYFGTLCGVRGFGDKQALTYQNGTSIFQQPDPSRTDLGYLLPYNLTDQVDGDLDHSWDGDHEARNGGLWNNWVAAKSEETMGYFTRNEIPFQYAVADAFTICDGYHQAIMAPTSPNRMYFWTGTSSGWTSNPNDYEVDFGSDAGTAEVTTYPELLQKAGVDWQVYTNDQVGDSGSYPDFFLGDYGDNPLWFYQQYNTSNSRNGGTSELADRGAVTPWQTDAGAPPLNKTHAAYVLSSFINDVKNNTLPQVSWIVAPAGYCEHPSYTPDYGAHYVNTVLQTLMSNPELWKNTALFITYDEHDGFFDHQLPPFPEPTVTDEYIDGLPIGPGTRVPMLICSPWTRGGYVDSNVYNHTSMLEFLAAWTGVKPANVTPWRASVTGDLTAAFDFEHPDFSIPANIPTLDQTWALTQLTGGSTTPPAEGDQRMPAQEPGTRPHRPTVHQPLRRRDRGPRHQPGHRPPDQHRHGRRLLRGLPRRPPARRPHPGHGAAVDPAVLHLGRGADGREVRLLRLRPGRVPDQLRRHGRAGRPHAGQIPVVTAAPQARAGREGRAHPGQRGQGDHRLHPRPERLRGRHPDRHRQVGRRQDRQLARPITRATTTW